MLHQERLTAKVPSGWRARWPGVSPSAEDNGEREPGLSVDYDVANALGGALIMGASFGLAALVPNPPYLFLPVNSELCVSVALAAMTLSLG